MLTSSNPLPPHVRHSIGCVCKLREKVERAAKEGKLRAEHQVPVPVKRTSKECRIKCEPDLKEKVKSIASSACARGHERQ